MNPSHWITVDGAELAVEFLPGPEHRAPLVCLHAGVTDSRLWNGVIEAAAGYRPLLRMDRRGFGLTRVRAALPHLLIDDLRAVLEALGLTQRLELLGCSQGGRVAIDFALAWPERVAGLTLVAPAVGGAPAGPLDEASQALADAIATAEARADLDEVNRLEAMLWLDGPGQPEGRVGGEARRLFLDMNRVALRSPPAGEHLVPPLAWPRLEQLLAPSCSSSSSLGPQQGHEPPALRLIWGELDLPLLVERCTAMHARLPGSRRWTMPAVAHLPSLEAPDRFNAVLAEAGLLPA